MNTYRKVTNDKVETILNHPVLFNWLLNSGIWNNSFCHQDNLYSTQLKKYEVMFRHREINDLDFFLNVCLLLATQFGVYAFRTVVVDVENIKYAFVPCMYSLRVPIYRYFVSLAPLNAKFP